jgi:WD40 repeat protein/tRNA A-37 threonylcarbamoyl transferase component Bud32
MSGDQPTDVATLTISGLERVVAICDEFESQWQAGGSPRIEDYLEKIPEQERLNLLVDLLELELELRRHAGESPEIGGYLARFPDQARLVERAFNAPSSGDWDTLIDADSPTLVDTSVRSRPSASRRFGDFELLDEIAAGGMGVVYKARQVSLNRIVALKMILAGQFASAGEVQRFQEGARASAQLRHSGIVPIHEIGCYRGRYYIAMEYVDGLSLARKVAESPLPPRAAAGVVRRIADAVQFAHSKGVIHRDLKPANVLLDEQSNPVVTDFGLAKWTHQDSKLTMPGQVVGTPSYMPPEQANGAGKIAPAADIYALGATFYCLLTGRPPFQAATVPETLRLVVEADPVPPRRLNPGVDRDLETICLRCLQKDPAKRYPSAGALAEDLDRFLKGEPIRARRVSLTEKVYLWSKRKPVLAGLVAAVFGLALILIGSTIVYTRRIQHALGQVQSKLVRQYLANGIQSMEAGDAFTALPWLVKALQLEHAGADAELTHRVRIAAVLSRFPRLVDVRVRDDPTSRYEYSPDGRRYATIEGTNVRVWDTASKSPVTPVLPHSDAVKVAQFSSDGRLLVTAWASRAQVWDAVSGSPVGERLVHEDNVNDASFSPDGRLLVVAIGSLTRGQFGQAIIWDVRTSQHTCPPLAHSDDVNQARFSSDGRLVATGSYDQTARIWNAATGAEESGKLEHKDSVRLVLFSPDGSQLLTASGTEARLWNTATGTSTLPPLRHRRPIRQAVFSASSRYVATLGYDQVVNVWDTATGELSLSPIPTSGQSIVAFDPYARRLVIANVGRCERTWDRAKEADKPYVLRHNHAVSSATYSNDGRFVLTASRDRSWRIWNAENGQLVLRNDRHVGPLRTACFSPDSRRVLTASVDNTARVWDARTGAPISRPLPHPDLVYQAVFSPDGSRVLTSCRDGQARVWDATTGQSLLVIRHGGIVRHASFNHDGSRIATASFDRTARISDSATGEAVAPVLRHQKAVVHVAFSPDGSRLVTSSDDRTARIWSCATGKPMGTAMQHEDIVVYAVFSPDGRHVVTASRDRTARVWDGHTGAATTPPLRHSDSVNQAIFSPDGLLVLTACGGSETSVGGETRVWDASTGDPVTLPIEHGDDVNTVCLSPDGRHILTASFDTTARIWPLPRADLSMAELRLLSELLTGTELDETGGLVPVSAGTLSKAWDALHSRHPRLFVATENDAMKWNEREAARCLPLRRWSLARYHLDQVLEKRPGPWQLHADRARALAELGELPAAAKDLDIAIGAGDDNPFDWYHLAVLRLVLHDLDGYRSLVSKALERYGKRQEPSADNLIAWMCALSAEAMAEPERAVALAERAHRASPSMPVYLGTLGATMFRAGRYEDALRLLREATKLSNKTDAYWEWLFLAMTERKLGHEDEARRWLAKADTWATPPTGPPGSGTQGLLSRSWDERVSFKFVRREAGSLLNVQPPDESR